MSNTNVFIVSDDAETVEKVKSYLQGLGVGTYNYGHGQWQQGLENSQFRASLSTGVPSLMGGLTPIEGGKILQFPTPGSTSAADLSKVATMNELESKAIENAIGQFRGNLTEAAKALGIGRATLYRKVKQYNIDPSQARRKRAA
jgi:hypothetical protein